MTSKERGPLTCSISSCASFTRFTLLVNTERAAALLSMSEETGALKLEEKPNNSKSAKSKKLFSFEGSAKDSQWEQQLNVKFFLHTSSGYPDRELKSLLSFPTRRNKMVTWCFSSWSSWMTTAFSLVGSTSEPLQCPPRSGPEEQTTFIQQETEP